MQVKVDRRILRRLSQDILLRTPTQAETTAYLGAEVPVVVKRMLGSMEAMEVWLEEELLYFLLLDNFRPRTKAIESLPRRLHKKQVTAIETIAEIMISTGFSLRNPGNDTFVTVVLEQGLGMTVQRRKNVKVLEAGKKMYDGYKVKFLGTKGNSQADVVKIVLAQVQATRHLLDRHYERLMQQPLPKTEEVNVTRVQEKPREFFGVLQEWLCSEKYLAAVKQKRPMSNHQFVRSLFMDLLGRTPNYQEFRRTRNALLSMADPTPLRAVVAGVVLNSAAAGRGRAEIPQMQKGKESEFLREAFLRYLGRAATQTEEQKFLSVLKKGTVTGRQVVLVLVTSVEYQFY